MCMIVLTLVLASLLFVGQVVFSEFGVIFPFVLEVDMLSGVVGVPVVA